MKLGSNNIDCREIGSKINASDPASYSFNTTIAGIDKADSCLLIGANPRTCAPIINARIRKRFLTGKLKIAAIGVGAELTYKYQNLGNEVKILQEILDGKSPYNKILETSLYPMLIIGEEMLRRVDGEIILNYAKKIAEKYKMIGNEWNGFNMLHNNASLTGGLLAGFVSSNPSVNSDTILEQALNKQIKAVYLLGVDDINLSRLENCFVIYQGSHGETGAAVADVILPSASYVEKDATFVNIESRPQQTTKALFAPKNAKEDWQIIFDLAKTLKHDLSFKCLNSIREIMAKINPIFSNINNAAKHQWIDASNINQLDTLDQLKEIAAQDGNFYNNNVIARLSRILNSCKNSLN